MPIAEITIVPVGVGSSVSDYVAEALRKVRARGLKYQLTPTSTIIEGELDELFQVLKEMHESPFKKGAPRVLTVIKIDDRRDKSITMEYKVRVVQEKLR
ncbi:MAG: MTH1187 family thiamine-binding protein [Candidatus Korarchaeota archaeon]|nr:MTH1187 family thiamine-binding protein [Candidatus Korarchaeota archaeon]